MESESGSTQSGFSNTWFCVAECLLRIFSLKLVEKQIWFTADVYMRAYSILPFRDWVGWNYLPNAIRTLWKKNIFRKASSDQKIVENSFQPIGIIITGNHIHQCFVLRCRMDPIGQFGCITSQEIPSSLWYESLWEDFVAKLYRLVTIIIVALTSKEGLVW